MDRFGHFAVAGVAVCSNALRACTAGGKNVRCQCHNCDYLCMGSSGALPVGLFLSALSPPGSTEQRYREMVAECRLSPEEVSGFVAEAIIAEEVSSGSADVSGRQPIRRKASAQDPGCQRSAVHDEGRPKLPASPPSTTDMIERAWPEDCLQSTPSPS
eukprot:GHVT01041452.1.p1 GENE.GHVT01041452.1~~GHVT01041452.1.p1  ORF type:complete len:158 (+),score=15.48 GHVT01041452.1:3898-4371(+)